MSYRFPLDYGHGCFLVPLDIALAPMVAGALDVFMHRRSWATDIDYELGYEAFCQLRKDMSAVCIAELLERQDRLYRLINAGLFGTEYTAVGDPPIITPAIPAAPDMTNVEPGLIKRIKRLEYLLDNAYNGASNAPWTATPGARDQLQAILDAMAAQGGGDEEIIEALLQIIALLA